MMVGDDHGRYGRARSVTVTGTVPVTVRVPAAGASDSVRLGRHCQWPGIALAAWQCRSDSGFGQFPL